MLCDFETTDRGCVCILCGRVVSAKVNCDTLRAECQADQRDPTTCVHFIGPTGENTKTAKDCGCKTATSETAVAECALHGRCTFIARAEDTSLPFCLACRDFQKETATDSDAR